MTVRKLKEVLKSLDENMDVIIELKVNGVEFTANIEDVYESRNIYIVGDYGEVYKDDIERWWGIKEEF